MDIGLNRSKFLQLLDLGELSLLLVRMPMVHPQEEAFLVIIHHAMDFPVEVGEPLQFHHVELKYWDAANFRPRAVLECVVVKELAAQEKGSRKHSIDGAR